MSAGDYESTLHITTLEAVCWLFYVGGFFPVYFCHEIGPLCGVPVAREESEGTTQHTTVQRVLRDRRPMKLLRRIIHPLILWLDHRGYSFSNHCRNAGSLKHNSIRRVIGKTTMVSYPRLLAVMDSMDYVARNLIPGDFVVCGVWKGGLVKAMADYFSGVDLRVIWAYDTFTGNPEPGWEDGKEAKKDWKNGFCYASEEEVRRNIGPRKYVRLIKGKVEETLQHHNNKPTQIALLYLDTDWYESTKVELEKLYPLVVPGGVIIMDDYGLCPGAEQAALEYFSTLFHKPLFVRLDVSARLFIKPGQPPYAPLNRGDGPCSGRPIDPLKL